jgi:hypothetical protein
MHSHGPRPDPLTDLGYEPQDVNLRKLGMALFFFFTFALVCIGGSSLIIKLMSPGYFDHRADMPALAKSIPAPPNPLLQTDVTAKTDIRDLRRREDVALTTPAWIDQQKGVVRVPIERAMELTVERAKSAPSAPAGSAAPSTTKVNGG